MAMGHVVLREFFVDRQVPYFADYVRRFTDLPFLVALDPTDGAYTAGKFLTAADLGEDRRERAVQDGAARRVHPRAGRAERVARLPLRRGGRRPLESRSRRCHARPPLHGTGEPVESCCRASTILRAGAAMRRGVPALQGRRATRDHRVRPAARQLRRRPRRPARRLADRLRRPVPAGHAGLAGGDHVGTRPTRPPASAASSPRMPRRHKGGR